MTRGDRLFWVGDLLYCRAVGMAAETEQARSRRRRQRTLFDGVARLYAASRPGYPGDVVEFAVATAAVGAGSEVLEVGCGTGQLTQSLAGYGFRKPAKLLRPGGWLALLEIVERYDDPLRAALLGMWAARGDGTAGVWQPHFADTEAIAATGLFEPPVRKTHTQRIVRPAEIVVGVENTRATSLSWPADIRREFTQELRHQLRSQTEVQLTQETSLTMARVLRTRPGPAE